MSLHQTIDGELASEAWPSLPPLQPTPKTLFARGNLGLFGGPSLAIVGSRRCSAQGAADAQDFAAEAVRRGVVVVSGLARGIDAAAHHGAQLESGKDLLAWPTVAVLGSGLDNIYPAGHAGLARSIVAHGGLLLTEHPAQAPALRHHFPLRNRLIAGLSQGVLIVEAAARSGALITAQLALELGRHVWVLPGSVHDPRNAGSHALIRQGATLVSSPEELFDDWGLWRTARLDSTEVPKTPLPAALAASLLPPERSVLQALAWTPIDLSTLMLRTNLPHLACRQALLRLADLGLAAEVGAGSWARFKSARRYSVAK